jgi:hypothetical protein
MVPESESNSKGNKKDKKTKTCFQDLVMSFFSCYLAGTLNISQEKPPTNTIASSISNTEICQHISKTPCHASPIYFSYFVPPTSSTAPSRSQVSVSRALSIASSSDILFPTLFSSSCCSLHVLWNAFIIKGLISTFLPAL